MGFHNASSIASAHVRKQYIRKMVAGMTIFAACETGLHGLEEADAIAEAEREPGIHATAITGGYVGTKSGIIVYIRRTRVRIGTKVRSIKGHTSSDRDARSADNTARTVERWKEIAAPTAEIPESASKVSAPRPTTSGGEKTGISRAQTCRWRKGVRDGKRTNYGTPKTCSRAENRWTARRSVNSESGGTATEESKSVVEGQARREIRKIERTQTPSSIREGGGERRAEPGGRGDRRTEEALETKTVPGIIRT
jgi:hypothetical protein